MRRLLAAALTASLAAAIAAAPAALSPEKSFSAAEKLDRISTDSMHPGETITLTEDEINSFLRYDYAPHMPDGVRDLTVQLQPDRGVAHAFVDLAKLQASTGSSLGLLWNAVLSGEREIAVTCRYVSANGQATVEILSAELNGTSIPKPVLDWLVGSVVAEHFAGVELGKPSPLPNNLKQIELQTDQALITSY